MIRRKNIKKKILIHGLTSNAGGIESFIYNYVLRFDKKKFDIHIICYGEKPAFYENFLEMGCKVHIVTSRKVNPFKNYYETKKIFKTYRFDVLWYNVCSLSYALPIKLAKELCVKKIILHSHASAHMFGLFNKILHRLNFLLVNKKINSFWACSELAANFMFPQRILRSNNYRIINNAIDLYKFKFNNTTRQRLRESLAIDESFVVGHIGRFNNPKNHEFLVDIFSAIIKHKVNARLVLVGNGENLPYIKDRVNYLGLKEKVLFLGEQKNVSDLLQSFDVLVLPSRYEGLGMVLIEGQAAGLQCFASSGVIPIAAKVTGRLEFISLNNEPDYWAQKIIKTKGATRIGGVSQISEKGYNINIEAKKVAKAIYSNN